MKRILFLALMALTFVSCNELDKEAPSRTQQFYRGARFDAAEFEFKGHKYISIMGGRASNGVVHDPECECQVRLREQVDSILTRMYD